MIPREKNDRLIEFARRWRLDGDLLTCVACKRSLIASRDAEWMGHASSCRFANQQHPWAELRALIAVPHVVERTVSDRGDEYAAQMEAGENPWL